MKTYNFVLGGQNGKFRRCQCINVMEICVYHAKIKLFFIPLSNRYLAVPGNQSDAISTHKCCTPFYGKHQTHA